MEIGRRAGLKHAPGRIRAVDGGEILAQAKVPIKFSDTPETLYARIQKEEHRLLPEVLASWRERQTEAEG